METCRACLSTYKDLSPVDENFLSDYNSLTELNVQPLDGFPECFCQTCMDTVHLFVKFKEKCISSEKTLREVDMAVNPSQSLDECEVDIKKENVDDSDVTCYNELENFEIKEEFKEECVVAFQNENNDAQIIKPTKQKCIRRGKHKRKCLANNVVTKTKIDKSLDEYFCGLCNESFVIFDSLKEHLQDHHTDKSCGICSKEFDNWPKLLTHRVFHSSKKYCHLCPRRFSSITRMEQHYLTVHYEEKIAEISCAHCPKKFTCPEKFSLHAETHNIGCHLCTEVLPNRHLLNEHLRSHEPEKRYACDMCEYTAIYANVLANHKKRRHKKFTCKICDRRFADCSKLKDHVCKDKSKLCPFCGQRIFDSYKRHLKSHDDAKTFKCERCPMSYKTELSLKVHMDRHDNNPTHPCDYCGRKFYAKSTLTKHRRVHTGEKPYACEKCGKRFTGNSNLRLHMKTHGIMLITKRHKEVDQSSTAISALAVSPRANPNLTTVTTSSN